MLLKYTHSFRSVEFMRKCYRILTREVGHIFLIFSFLKSKRLSIYGGKRNIEILFIVLDKLSLQCITLYSRPNVRIENVKAYIYRIAGNVYFIQEQAFICITQVNIISAILIFCQF